MGVTASGKGEVTGRILGRIMQVPGRIGVEEARGGFSRSWDDVAGCVAADGLALDGIKFPGVNARIRYVLRWCGSVLKYLK